MVDATGVLLIFVFASGIVERMSSDAEDDFFSSDEEDEAQCGELHAVLVCASCLQSSLQRSLHEEELSKVALTCHFSLDVIFLLSGLNAGAIGVSSELVSVLVAVSHQGWATTVMDRDVMGDLYRDCNDASRLECCSIR